MSADGRERGDGAAPEGGLAGGGEAAQPLLDLVYEQLRALAARIMAGERADHTLQPTALVHEAWLRLAGTSEAAWADEAHFKAVSVRAMRQVLVDHARRKRSAKRGGDRRRVSLCAVDLAEGRDRLVDALTLDRALRRLEALNERHARVVELRFLGGLTVEETARVLSVDPSTVKADWAMARAILAETLEGEPGD